jgi:hypothetical protein
MLHGSTSLEEAARRIGENAHVLTQLIKSGILATAIRAGTKGYAAPILKTAAVDELIERLIDGVPLARLLGSPRSRLGPLENMPLSSAVLAIAKVGSLEVLRKGERFEAVSRKRRLECKMTAGEIFQSWPESFDEILDRRVLDSKECQPKSLGQTYGVWAS